MNPCIRTANSGTRTTSYRRRASLRIVSSEQPCINGDVDYECYEAEDEGAKKTGSPSTEKSVIDGSKISCSKPLAFIILKLVHDGSTMADAKSRSIVIGSTVLCIAVSRQFGLDVTLDVHFGLEWICRQRDFLLFSWVLARQPLESLGEAHHLSLDPVNATVMQQRVAVGRCADVPGVIRASGRMRTEKFCSCDDSTLHNIRCRFAVAVKTVITFQSFESQRYNVARGGDEHYRSRASNKYRALR